MSRRRAVAVMDSVQHLGLLSRRELERAHDLARGRRGVARTHTWWELSDGRAESPLETFGRLDCVDHGVPPDDLQVNVLDRAGRFLGRGDMGWRLPGERWLIAEVDGGEVHGAVDALFRDRSRQNALVTDGGAEVLRFTSRDVEIPGAMSRQVKRHLDRARGSVRSSTTSGSFSRP